MNADTQVTMEEFHDAVESGIRAAFPSLKLVEFYREESDRQPFRPEQLPACLLELTELEPAPMDEDPGTEQLAVDARLEARIVMGFRTQQVKRQVRANAAALGAWLRLHRWPHPTRPGETLPTGPAMVIAIEQDGFSPNLDQYEVWRVEWIQRLHLGESVWTDVGDTPHDPRMSWAPEIGPAHESNYVPLVQP